MPKKQEYLLVVEDIPDILNLLETTLKFKGYRVVTARDGREALEAVERERPALVITDILMPGIDGFGLLHRLRLHPQTRDLPVIFLTATYIDPEDRDFAHSIGVTRFTEKPVNLDEFLPMVADLLEHGAPSGPPIRELDFYRGYRKRLEKKLEQKTAHIARAESLLETLPEEEKSSFKASLLQTRAEREEIRTLLDQVKKSLEQLPK
jgi:CheY-like chemotaxis protein